MRPLAKWKKNVIIKKEIPGRPLTHSLGSISWMGVFIAAGTRGGQFGETRFPDGRAGGRGVRVVFASASWGRGTRAVDGQHVRFLFEDRLLVGGGVSHSPSVIRPLRRLGSSETRTRAAIHASRTTNSSSSSSHTPIWPFVNQCVGSGSRWSEIAE